MGFPKGRRAKATLLLRMLTNSDLDCFGKASLPQGRRANDEVKKGKT